MYLRGLGDAGFDVIQNTSQMQCESQYHGFWSAYGQGGNYVMNPMGTCTVARPPAPTPAPAPAPQIHVSVPTNVNTQVSPQVSPNLIQQQQPTNSPVGAATSASPAQTPTNTNTTASDAAYQGYLQDLQSQREAEKADREALIKALQGSGSAPSQSAPSMMFAPSGGGDAGAGDGGAAPAGASVTIAPDHTSLYVKGALLAALIVGGAVIYSQHKKPQGKHRHVH